MTRGCSPIVASGWRSARAGFPRYAPASCGPLLGPLFGALLWGRMYGAGVIAGFALPLVIAGSVPGILAYHVYWLVERGYSVWSKERPPTFVQR